MNLGADFEDPQAVKIREIDGTDDGKKVAPATKPWSNTGMMTNLSIDPSKPPIPQSQC